MMNAVLLLHFFLTAFMCGVIWFCQVVHYPLFRQIPSESFCDYEQKNMVTGYIVVPAMLLELGTGLWLFIENPIDPYILNIAMLGLTWLSTALLQGPMHTRLTKDPDLSTMLRLVRTNWIRTIAWTLRSVLLGYIIVRGLRFEV